MNVRYVFLVFILILNSNVSAQQNDTNQNQIILKTYKNDSLIFPSLKQGRVMENNKLQGHLQKKEYEKYIGEFFKIYISDSTKKGYVYEMDLYNLACAYARTGNTSKAFEALNILVAKHKYSDGWVLGDRDFESLHKDGRWLKFSDQVRKNYFTKFPRITHPELAFQLSIWHGLDQTAVRNNTTIDNRKKFRLNNSAMLDSLAVIFAVYGYPTPKMVGKEAYVPALIIAHAPYNIQLLYKDFLYREALKGNIPAGWAGIVIDKILVKQGKPQLYGTQGCYDSSLKKVVPCPIDDIENIEQRREKMGFLMSWREYVKMQDSINQ